MKRTRKYTSKVEIRTANKIYDYIDTLAKKGVVVARAMEMHEDNFYLRLFVPDVNKEAFCFNVKQAWPWLKFFRCFQDRAGWWEIVIHYPLYSVQQYDHHLERRAPQ